MSRCYTDQQGCYVCPEQPFIPSVPAHVQAVARVGWNAGANSVQALDGDLRVVFQPPMASGVVIGLRTGQGGAGQLGAIEQGICVRRIAGAYAASVVERGRVMNNARWVQPDDDLEIRRITGVVTILINGSLWFTSMVSSEGAKVVGGCLYASGDILPVGVPAPTPAPSLPSDAFGDVALVSGAVVDADAGGHDKTDFSDCAGWYIDVPAGASNVTFVVTPPANDPAHVGIAVNYPDRPTGSLTPAVFGAFSGFTFEPDYTLSFDNPSAGRWYVVLVYQDVDPSGYTLTATVT